VLTWLYTIVDYGQTVRVPYDMQTGMIYWRKWEPWTEPPSNINDDANLPRPRPRKETTKWCRICKSKACHHRTGTA